MFLPGKTCKCSDCPAACDEDDEDDDTNGDSDEQTKSLDKYFIPVAATIWVVLTAGLLFSAYFSKDSEREDVVLTNLAEKSTVPLAENVYTKGEEVPIKMGKVEFKGPPVNRTQHLIRFVEFLIIGYFVLASICRI